AYNGLGSILNNQGKLVEALAAFDRAVAIAEPSLGADHPQVGMMLIGRGFVLVSLERLQDAETSLSRAIAIFERDGSTREYLVSALLGKGDVQKQLHQLPAAL